MAILRDIRQKIKGFSRLIEGDIWLVLVIFLVSVASFGLGRLSVLRLPHESLQIAYPPEARAEAAEGMVAGAVVESGQYVASKSGSKYHFPWCAGAQAIKEENKVWFASKEEAEAAGYGPAANCKGL